MKNTLRFLFATTFGFAFATSVAQSPNFCGTDELTHQLVEQYPDLLQSEQELREFTNQFNLISGQRTGPIIIPVVFHIIHREGTENITDAQVLDQMRILNNDYNKRNADTALVIPSFKS